MGTIYCDSCGAENLDSVKFCKQCGNKLTIPEHVDVANRSSEVTAAAGARSQISVENKYAALRGIASLCRILSYVFVGLAALGALGGLIAMFNSFLTGLGAIIGATVWGAVTYVFWQIVAEGITVLLDIELNTRQVASLLEQRLQ